MGIAFHFSWILYDNIVAAKPKYYIQIKRLYYMLVTYTDKLSSCRPASADSLVRTLLELLTSCMQFAGYESSKPKYTIRQFPWSLHTGTDCTYSGLQYYLCRCSCYISARAITLSRTSFVTRRNGRRSNRHFKIMR